MFRLRPSKSRVYRVYQSFLYSFIFKGHKSELREEMGFLLLPQPRKNFNCSMIEVRGILCNWKACLLKSNDSLELWSSKGNCTDWFFLNQFYRMSSAQQPLFAQVWIQKTLYYTSTIQSIHWNHWTRTLEMSVSSAWPVQWNCLSQVLHRSH